MNTYKLTSGVGRTGLAALLIAVVLFAAMVPVAPVQAATVPTFSIISINPGVSITVQTANFPSGQNFTVRMGPYGTLAIGGVAVGTIDSPGGAFQATFAIPDTLKSLDRIAIRMDSSGGYYAYNWFWNNSSGTGGTPAPVVTTVPTFKIKDVVLDSKVTIVTSNFPANVEFKVRMGAYGTLAIGGTEVATLNSGSGGSFEATFDIPAGLKGSQRIAIRLDSGPGYFAYNWFWNNTSSGGTGGIPGYTGIPTFSIKSVEKDSKVTIVTNNFPKELDFRVRMGAYGTQGVGGTEIATLNSGSGGSFEATFDIPEGLKGSQRIAIRLENTATGYYAYNWFWNNTANTGTSTDGGTGGIPGYSGIPTFNITGVTRDSSVTVQTYNLPPNQEFTVRMGPYGTLGVGGVVVTTFNSGAGGAQSLTFSVPDGLKGSDRIAVRMDCPAGFFAFNWFWNFNA